MNNTFKWLHRLLARALAAVLLTTIGVFSTGVAFALVGYPRVAQSLGQVTIATAVMSAGLFIIFAASSLTAAIVHRLEN